MRKDIKEKWVAALRSDKYEQGVGALCYQNEDGDKCFCCLGVLVDQIKDEFNIVVEKPLIRGNFSFLYKKRTISVVLGEILEDDLKLPHNHTSTLMYLNDGKVEEPSPLHSFSQIADWIEANVEETP